MRYTARTQLYSGSDAIWIAGMLMGALLQLEFLGVDKRKARKFSPFFVDPKESKQLECMVIVHR